MAGGGNEKSTKNNAPQQHQHRNHKDKGDHNPCSGTVKSFNNHGEESQDFSKKTIDSGKNSVASNIGAGTGSSENTRRSVTGTVDRFNKHEEGSQDFSDATKNNAPQQPQHSNRKDKGDHNLNLSVTSSTSSVIHCSGTVDSFNNHGKGSQDFSDVKINSGMNSGPQNGASNIGASTGSGENTSRSVTGTHSSFECYGKGSQKFSGEKINSDKNSGASNIGAGTGSGESTSRSVTGTQSSFNCYRNGSQNFSGAKINSGENSGRK